MQSKEYEPHSKLSFKLSVDFPNLFPPVPLWKERLPGALKIPSLQLVLQDVTQFLSTLQLQKAVGKNKRGKGINQRKIGQLVSKSFASTLCSAGCVELLGSIAPQGGLHWGCREIRGDIAALCKTCGNQWNWRTWEGWQGGPSALSSMFPRKPSTANITSVLPCGPAHVMSRTISHNSAQKVSKTWWNVQWFWPDCPAGNETRNWGCLHLFWRVLTDS